MTYCFTWVNRTEFTSAAVRPRWPTTHHLTLRDWAASPGTAVPGAAERAEGGPRGKYPARYQTKLKDSEDGKVGDMSSGVEERQAVKEKRCHQLAASLCSLVGRRLLRFSFVTESNKDTLCVCWSVTVVPAVVCSDSASYDARDAAIFKAALLGIL